MTTRNELVKDLGTTTIDVLLENPEGAQYSAWLTLEWNKIPQAFFTQEFVRDLNSFHDKNPNMVMAWNVRDKGWFRFDMDAVKYCQIKDNT
jgi:hypothetical protein